MTSILDINFESTERELLYDVLLVVVGLQYKLSENETIRVNVKIVQNVQKFEGSQNFYPRSCSTPCDSMRE